MFGIIYPIILFGIIVAVYFLGNYERDWSTRADQELTLAYNAILVNSGHIQEYIDHPGVLTIHLIALYMKVLNQFGILSIIDIDSLNNAKSLFDAFNQITQSARLTNLLSISILVLVIFQLSNLYLNNINVAFAYTLVLIFSTGILEHLIYLRTELLTFIALLVSIYFFLKALANKTNQINYYLILSCSFFFLAAVNKAQVIFYYPIYLLWAVNVSKNDLLQSGTNHDDPCRRYWSLLIIMNTVFFVTLAHGISKWFQLVYIFLLNAIVLIFLNNKYKYKFISLFNFHYVFGYGLVVIFIYILTGNISLFFTLIDSPLEMLKWSTANSLQQEKNGLDTAGLLWRSFDPLRYIVTQPSSQIALLLFNFGLFITYYRKILPVTRNILILGFVCFYLTSIISATRYWSSNYFIFSDFFLFANLLIMLRFLLTLNAKIITLVLLILVTLAINSSKMVASNNTDRRLAVCASTYLLDWHQQINKEKIREACDKYRN